jgi:hypothetical protein
MTDRELMQQALEAFGGLLTFNPSPAEYKQGRDVVAALRERLSQPETTDVTPEVTPDVKPVQVSPLEFIAAAFDKEFLYGKPIMWAEWPNRARGEK